jgi:hypothetical protein
LLLPNTLKRELTEQVLRRKKDLITEHSGTNTRKTPVSYFSQAFEKFVSQGVSKSFLPVLQKTRHNTTLTCLVADNSIGGYQRDGWMGKVLNLLYESTVKKLNQTQPH